MRAPTPLTQREKQNKQKTAGGVKALLVTM